ncbi:protein AF1q [Spea bombifrons]|uniref:protein AF1q n=1 Tax=Spea bombifrons TaxID=233779 RepID=UPI00234AB879|nr:protein AF1q [Spea bombifrons]
MLDTASSQYNSFMFWKLPIPELDLSELECLGFEDPKKKQSSFDKKSGDEEDILSQYTAFNYWRAPIASIDSLDFDLI